MSKEKLFGIVGVLLLVLVGLKFLDSTLIWQLGRIDFQKASGLLPEQVEFIGFADREEAESRARAWENGLSKDIKVVSYYNFREPTAYLFVNNKATREVMIPWLGEVAIAVGRTHIGLSKWSKASLEIGSESRTIDSLLMGSWFSLDFGWIKHLMFLSRPEDQKRLIYKGVGLSKYIFVLYFHILLLALLLVSGIAVVQMNYYVANCTWKTFKDYKGEKILHHEWALIAFFWILPLVWAV